MKQIAHENWKLISITLVRSHLKGLISLLGSWLILFNTSSGKPTLVHGKKINKILHFDWSCRGESRKSKTFWEAGVQKMTYFSFCLVYAFWKLPEITFTFIFPQQNSSLQPKSLSRHKFQNLYFTDKLTISFQSSWSTPCLPLHCFWLSSHSNALFLVQIFSNILITFHNLNILTSISQV